MFDLFFDNEYVQDGICTRIEKCRLYKCVDKKGNFMWWEWFGEDNIKGYNSKLIKSTQDIFKLEDKYKVETSSGFVDFTPEGKILELTDDQRARALTRKVKL
jgi:hypothetical protein